MSKQKLGLVLKRVQTEMKGTMHYKDENGNRLVLYIDGSYGIEPHHKTLCNRCQTDEPEIRKKCTANCEEHQRERTPQ